MLRQKLTPKQTKFVAEYTKNGGNGTQAALVAYPNVATVVTARVIACENLMKPYIRSAVEAAGLKMSDAVLVVRDALKAESDGKPDHHVRLRAADITLKLHDAYPRDRREPQEAREAIDITPYQTLPLPVLKYRATVGQWPATIAAYLDLAGELPSEEHARLLGLPDQSPDASTP